MELNFGLKTHIFSEDLVDITSLSAVSYEQLYTINANHYILTSYEDTILFPVSILNKHSGLQAIVVYLKDNKGLKFSCIARLLNRDQRTIWTSYNKSSDKKKNGISPNKVISTNMMDTIISVDSEYFIPVNIFSIRNLSVLENIVLYLKSNYNLSFNEIAKITGKNYRTIWTVYKRALKKYELCEL